MATYHPSAWAKPERPKRDVKHYDPVLLNMLSFGRPHNSAPELAFIKKFIVPLGAKPDGYGNFTLQIGESPILWSCHTDTVHSYPLIGQSLETADGYISLRKHKSGRVLGADDAAGVWLMTELIKAETPGLYVFHRGEECGGLGSTWRATHAKDMAHIKCAIALDRKGYGDVITHQGKRCCSDAFGQSLADQLGGSYKNCDRGLFTDTANYTGIIGECTNLSVGYDDAHTSNEWVDSVFLSWLRDRLFAIDPDKLVFERKPGEKEVYDWSKYRHYNYGHGGDWSNEDWYGGEDGEDYRIDPKEYTKTPTTGIEVDYESEPISDDLISLCEDYPTVAAAILEDMGYDADAFMKILIQMGIK